MLYYKSNLILKCNKLKKFEQFGRIGLIMAISFYVVLLLKILAQTWQIRDKTMHGIRSPSRNFCCANEERTRGIKCVRNIIQDLERYGSAGLLHITILSDIIGKPIKIWNYDGSLNRIVGKEKKGRPIDVEYHPIDSKHTQIGHWTLRHGKDPDDTIVDLNSCLFSVIGSQTGQDPSKLREQLVLKLKRNLQELACQVDEIIRLKGNDGITLMIGGARYNGNSPRDAAIILDNSQNVLCENCRYLGHPRGHASHPHATGNLDSVENYARSTGKRRTGFLSRNDQNLVAHLALSTQQAQNAMEKLNTPEESVSEEISTEILKAAVKPYRAALPKAKLYDCDGISRQEKKDFLTVILVMRHHQNKMCMPDADVFVVTFYPFLGKYLFYGKIEQ
ncbi:uncharacterized protein LOC113562316 [Ooceraea biroi]|uniref:uncharacterized protein LOC113562316 n=1 Tax=Ooceraea biroi TaxID=2015173 RepID=UPI000F076F19|nr:uncharacterized protein LOC113562316 [Ooceraea biroi]